MPGMRTIAGIIDELGGVAYVARAAGVHVTRVYAWVRNNRVPLSKIPLLVAHGQREGKPISHSDFFPAVEAGAEWPAGVPRPAPQASEPEAAA